MKRRSTIIFHGSITQKTALNIELGHVFDQFPRYDMKILLGDFNAKVSRENIFKPTIRNERVHMKLVMIMELE
jgi:hypothetical protein